MRVPGDKAYAGLAACTFAGLLVLYAPPLWEGVRVLLTEAPGAGLGDGGDTTRRAGLLVNTILVATGATFISGLVGLAGICALWWAPRSVRPVFLFFLLAPVAMPSYVLASGWWSVIGGGIWTVSASLGRLAMVSAILGLAHFPLVVLTGGHRLWRFPKGAHEAGALYRGESAGFRGVVLPLLWPDVLGGMLLAFLFNLTTFSVPALFQVQVYPAEIFAAFSAFYDTPGALRLCLPLAGLGLAGVALLRGMQARWSFPGMERGGWPEARQVTRCGRAVAIVVLLIIALVSLGIPLGVQGARAFPLAVYRDVLQTASSELQVSLWTASAGATLMVLLGFVAAHGARGGWWWGRLALVGLAPFLLSGTALGILMVQAWNRPGMWGAAYDSGWILVLGSAARYTVLLYLGCRALLALVPVRLEEAARVTGVGAFGRLVHVTVPLLTPGLAGAWCVGFLLAFGELDVAALVYPPGMATVPVRTFSLLHYGPTNMTGALNVVVATIVLLMLAVSMLLIHRGARRMLGDA